MTFWSALKQIGKGIALSFFALGAMPYLLVRVLCEIMTDYFS